MYSYIYDFFKQKSAKNLLSFNENKFVDYVDEYTVQDAWGMSTSLDCHECNLEFIKSDDKIREYVIGLCNLINMNRYGECTITEFGIGKMQGYTMIQLIETSNITAHFSNDTRAAYIDLFSCKPYDPNLVLKYTKKFFEASSVDMNVVLRK